MLLVIASCSSLILASAALGLLKSGPSGASGNVNGPSVEVLRSSTACVIASISSSAPPDSLLIVAIAAALPAKPAASFTKPIPVTPCSIAPAVAAALIAFVN